MPNITSASVRVMRSHDDCHFEVVLGGTIDADRGEKFITVDDVDQLRKKAARLADKAVKQFIISKEIAQKRLAAGYSMKALCEEADRIMGIPESDRTPAQVADLKAYKDALFHAQRHYDYEDNWQDDEDDD